MTDDATIRDAHSRDWFEGYAAAVQDARDAANARVASVSDYVWVQFDVPPGCQCWREALCPHGWEWSGDGTPEWPACDHLESYTPVHASLADAIRDTYSLRGRSGIGSLLRYRRGASVRVYVMPPGGPWADDHEANDGPTPLKVISRERVIGRSTPRNDVGRSRYWADEYRRQ